MKGENLRSFLIRANLLISMDAPREPLSLKGQRIFPISSDWA